MTSIQPPTRRLAGLLYAALLSSVLPAQANGFADLQAALARQQSLVPVKGSFRIETWTRQGDGKDGSEEQGQAVLNFEDGNQGLRLQFSRDTLQRVEQEERTSEKDGKAPTPALTGLRAGIGRPAAHAGAGRRAAKRAGGGHAEDRGGRV